jgi:hypothetical protein
VIRTKKVFSFNVCETNFYLTSNETAYLAKLNYLIILIV